MQDNARKPDRMPWHSSSVQDVMSELETSLDGLNDREAAERLQKHGTNTLLRKGKDLIDRSLPVSTGYKQLIDAPSAL